MQLSWAQGDLQDKHVGRFWQSLSKCEEGEMGLSDVEDCLASSLQVGVLVLQMLAVWRHSIGVLPGTSRTFSSGLLQALHQAGHSQASCWIGGPELTLHPMKP